MKEITNECVDCTSVGLHCLGRSCPNRNVVHYYCDECGYEGKLYHYGDRELCEDCLLEEVDVVEGSDY